MGVLLESMKVALSSNKAVTFMYIFPCVLSINDKLKCKEIILLNIIVVYLLVTVATFEISLTQALLCPLKDG